MVETVVAVVLGTVTDDADLVDACGDGCSSSSLGFRRSEISTLATGYLGTQSICATRYGEIRRCRAESSWLHFQDPRTIRLTRWEDFRWRRIGLRAPAGYARLTQLSLEIPWSEGYRYVEGPGYKLEDAVWDLAT
jgi:hypothetical protein